MLKIGDEVICVDVAHADMHEPQGHAESRNLLTNSLSYKVLSTNIYGGVRLITVINNRGERWEVRACAFKLALEPLNLPDWF